MRLKEYFWDGNNTQVEQPKTSKKASSWTPTSGRDKALDCYISAREKTLKCDKNIVIFQADKGTSVVV